MYSGNPFRREARHVALLACAVTLTISTPVHASCGSAFCNINTSWDVQGIWTKPGVRFDLRYEYIDQDQPRTGTHAVSVGEIPSHHDEVSTTNRNLRATLDFTVNQRFGVSVIAPVIDRSHLHIHNHHGERIPESWDFTELGDVSVIGRYHLTPAGRNGFGVKFGLKLPTGATDVANNDGDVAERSLQPGTGTTDGILGGYYQSRLAKPHVDWFVQGTYRHPFNEHENYQPGYDFSADLGVNYSFKERLRGMLQINFNAKGADSGEEAEPEDSGGRFVFLSPGLAYQAGDRFQVYGFVQVPIYQHVNGVQLTADWAASVGISTEF